ncbi:hypothetical protein M5K25_023833 [Dendrobium thyrsiflorum]|uniref:Uncharacterized protein n=1 Tax=Dendrobium thyrsiflorum TaxID=117978 RepID=A0ABD0U0H1_DENTH
MPRSLLHPRVVLLFDRNQNTCGILLSDRSQGRRGAYLQRSCAYNEIHFLAIGFFFLSRQAYFQTKDVSCLKILEDSEKIDIGSDSFEDPSENLERISEIGQLKRPVSTTSTGRRKKIFGSTFLRSQITQLVNSCTNIASETNASKINTTSATSSISAAIKVLEQTSEVFEDMQLYFYSTKLLEDPNKREIFISICPDRRVTYLRYCYENQNTT